MRSVTALLGALALTGLLTVADEANADWDASALEAPEPPPAAPVPVVRPAPPPASPPRFSGDWPGDEEAKADFQRSRPVPDLSPARLVGRYGSAEVYGFGKYDYLHDSKVSFGPVSANYTLNRSISFFNEPQTQSTLCDSRVGLRLETPDARVLAGTFLFEAGPELAEFSCHDLRRRHLYVAMRSPIVDVLVGRYYGLYGWGGKGFLPNTAAVLAPPGKLYHLEGQIRVSHIFRWRPIDFEIAGAVAESPQTNPQSAELHFASRLSVNLWRGASAQGAGPPVAAPLQVGSSVVRRSFSVPAFTASAANPNDAVGYAFAIDLFAPLIPAHGDDLGNSLSFTLERSQGKGFADWYPGLTGGVSFPALPNPAMTLPVPVYMANLPQGLATYDASGVLHLIEWDALTFGAQYHPPFARGHRVWLSGLLSFTHSDNAAALAPQQAEYTVWGKGWYWDASVFVAIMSPLQLAASYQTTHQTMADGVETENDRVQVSAAFYF
jgi:hypothetical protein